MNSKSKKLRSVADRYLKHDLDYEGFESEFYHYFLDEVETGEITSQEEEFYSLLQEKMEWTVKLPTKEDEKYGTINHDQYYDFAESLFRKYKNNIE